MLAVIAAISFFACDDTPPIGVIEPPPDGGCARPIEPRHYEVFFVVDVSGSMEPFLKDVRSELESFAVGFPEEDAMGRSVRVDYWLIAFVNDTKVFGGGRMSSPIALAQAIDDALVAGRTGNNLNTDTANVEAEENLLDALAQVRELSSSPEALLVMIATDAAFVERPAVLNQGIMVQHTYAEVRTELEALGARVHAFTQLPYEGLSTEFEGQPALTALPGSTVQSLADLTGARDRVREALNEIARNASCN
jgi:hypothetical protein